MDSSSPALLSSITSIPSLAPLTCLTFSHPSPSSASRVAAGSLDHNVYVLPASALDNDEDDDGDGGGTGKEEKKPVVLRHDAPIFVVRFCHPGWGGGSILASGGADGYVHIWEQDFHSSWSRRATLGDPKNGSIRALEFSPWFGSASLGSFGRGGGGEGLRILSLSSSSHLTLSHCLDPSTSFLSEWTTITSIDLSLPPWRPFPHSHSVSGSGGGDGRIEGMEGLEGTGDSMTDHGATAPFLGGSNASPFASPAFGTPGGNHQLPLFSQQTGTARPGSSLNPAGPSSSAALGSKSTTSRGKGNQDRDGGKTSTGEDVGTIEAFGGWGLSWIKEGWWGDRVAITEGGPNNPEGGVVKLFILPSSPSSHPINFLTLSPSTTTLHSDGEASPNDEDEGDDSVEVMAEDFSEAPRRGQARKGKAGKNRKSDRKYKDKTRSIVPLAGSVAWAPGCGRDYQSIATGHLDGSVRIYKVWPPTSPLSPNDPFNNNRQFADPYGEEEWSWELTTELGGDLLGSEDGGTGGTKVEWNSTGTCLLTSCPDGNIRMWKSTYAGEWRLVSVITCSNEK